MKYIFSKVIFAAMIMTMFVGCGGTTPNTPQLPITKQFRFDGVTFYFAETHSAEIPYHTDKELEALLNAKIVELLKEKNLFSSDPTMNKLEIRASYIRTFAGDETPFPSDTLAYPMYSYRIEIFDNSTLLRVFDRKDLVYKGGDFMMTMKALTFSMRDKTYEIPFIEAFAKAIVESIENLPRKINE